MRSYSFRIGGDAAFLHVYANFIKPNRLLNWAWLFAVYILVYGIDRAKEENRPVDSIVSGTLQNYTMDRKTIPQIWYWVPKSESHPADEILSAQKENHPADEILSANEKKHPVYEMLIANE